MNAARAEIRKLFTVRSTYAWLLIALGIGVGLMGFWIFGYKDVQHANQHTDVLLQTLLAVASFLGTALAFPVLLSVGHEYRYNTILYSLTNTRNRLNVFGAKWFVGTVFALVAAAVLMVLATVGFYAGQHLNHTSMLAQTAPGWDLVWRSGAAVAGGVAFAFIIALLVRSMVAAFILFLLLPSTIEQLLTLVLKDNAQYLPFTALGNITSTSPHPTPVTSAAVVAVYVLVLGAVAAVLFMRRDAN